MSPSIFSPEELAQIVRDTLPPAPKGHRIVVVGTVDATGAPVVAGFRSTAGAWEFTAAYHHDWTGEDDVSARVIYTRY